MGSTSERVTPESYQDDLGHYLLYLMHVKTYEFALPYVKDNSVLDLGCGDGYGDALLARVAAQVTAVDVSTETIAAAQQKYPLPNLRFHCVKPAEQEELPFNDDSFDVAVSFQVIEHLQDHEAFLKQIKRVLKPNGVFILSTPNAQIRLLPFQSPWNKFHLKEFTISSLSGALRPYFNSVKIFGLSLREPWLGIERRRTDVNKWLLYPMTNNLVPRKCRQFLLHKAWDLFAALKRPSVRKNGRPRPAPEDAIVTQEKVDSCPSLIGVCTNA